MNPAAAMVVGQHLKLGKDGGIRELTQGTQILSRPRHSLDKHMSSHRLDHLAVNLGLEMSTCLTPTDFIPSSRFGCQLSTSEAAITKYRHILLGQYLRNFFNYYLVFMGR
jgi:hypothetical protein